MVGQHTHSVSVCNYEESRNNWEKCTFYVKVRLSLISKSALQKKERKKSLYKHWVARTDRQRALFHSATFICLLVSPVVDDGSEWTHGKFKIRPVYHFFWKKSKYAAYKTNLWFSNRIYGKCVLARKQNRRFEMAAINYFGREPHLVPRNLS